MFVKRVYCVEAVLEYFLTGLTGLNIDFYVSLWKTWHQRKKNIKMNAGMGKHFTINN